MKSLKSGWCLFAIVLLLCASGCQSRTENSPTPTVGRAEGGGVDVGNMNAISVPGTHLVVTPPETWRQTISKDELLYQGPAGTSVRFSLSDLTDVTSPRAESLKLILDAREPRNQHKIVRFNGLEGVRTEWSSAGRMGRVRLYLVSELSDFVKVEMDFANAPGEVEEAEKLARSARILYKGQAIQGSLPQVVPISDIADRAYSFSGDCIGYHSVGCRGVYVEIRKSMIENQFMLSIGTSGADTGRIVELGPEAEVPFDQIRVEGPFLVSPDSQTRLEDIYARFSPDNRVPERNSMMVRPGYTYLLRTIAWPEEDLITKVRVESRNGVASLTYEKLVSVPESELQRQVDAINQYTRIVDVPKSSGEVVLFNRSVYGAYSYAGFNFEYGTSGNHFITANSWDLLYTGGSMGLGPSAVTGHLSDIVDLGEGRSLESVTKEDLPNGNDWEAGAHSYQPVRDHTYLVWNVTRDRRMIIGAVKVVEIAEDRAWILLQWRRVSIEEAPRTQRWIELGAGDEVKSVTLRYRPGLAIVEDSQSFSLLSGQNGASSPDTIIWTGALYTDTRPFKSESGFFRLPDGSRLSSIDVATIEGLRGRFAPSVNEPKAGQIYAFRSENYQYRVLGVIEVRAIRGFEIELGIRVLSRARAPHGWPIQW